MAELADTATPSDKIDVLLEEYKQLYEYARHDDRIAANKESVFIGISYGILAYTASLELTPEQLYAAAVASLSVYFWHVFACERMAFYYEARFVRIKEIEAKLLRIARLRHKTFQMDIDAYFAAVRESRRENRTCASYLNPYNWLVVLSESVGIRPVRMAMSLILIALWVFRIQSWTAPA